MIVELLREAATSIPSDVVEGLRRAYERETNPLARRQLEAILKNIELAQARRLPVCQDTGTPYFYVKLGDRFPLRSEIYALIRDAVAEATKSVPLRPNAVDPIRGRNSGNNTGRFIPWIEVELVEGDHVEVAAVLKGGGSEAPSRLMVASPLEAGKRLWELVLRAIVEAGPRPCPPVIIGVGIGAGPDIAMSLAKKAAVLREVGSRHPEPEVAALEEKLLEAVNKLGIGPHGFGGMTTALDLHIEYAHRHPATFAIAVSTSCWATRRAKARMDSSGSWFFIDRDRKP
jgi:fumarate hydratase subunit alpha